MEEEEEEEEVRDLAPPTMDMVLAVVMVVLN